jgi:UDP-glucose 4-epimerase
MKKTIFVTGGAGYIGSHTCVELLNAGYEIVVADNLSNSNKESIKRVEKITNKKFDFYQVDLRDETKLKKIFEDNKFDSVIHFAGLKAVGESVEKPLLYYDNNIVGSIILLKMMMRHKVNNFVFSSSCCVYGDPKKVPITEDFPIKPINPYGHTKAMIEQIIKDVTVAQSGFRAIILRYFNPVGAHKSGLIGEDPNGIPNNLVPYISQVAVGKLSELKVYGGDYHTPDGTGVRDYIHVVDLAIAHLKAIERTAKISGYEIFNLGSGTGHSVLEMVNAFEKASGQKITYRIVDRRAGDAPQVYANPKKANEKLDWRTEKDIYQMCEDVWRWQSKNPNGYAANKAPN